jgi:predicted transcriptional regulator
MVDNEDIVTISIYAPRELSEKLDKIAAKENRSKSSQCEYVLKKFVEEYGKVK